MGTAWCGECGGVQASRRWNGGCDLRAEAAHCHVLGSSEQAAWGQESSRRCALSLLFLRHSACSTRAGECTAVALFPIGYFLAVAPLLLGATSGGQAKMQGTRRGVCHAVAESGCDTLGAAGVAHLVCQIWSRRKPQVGFRRHACRAGRQAHRCNSLLDTGAACNVDPRCQVAWVLAALSAPRATHGSRGPPHRDQHADHSVLTARAERATPCTRRKGRVPTAQDHGPLQIAQAGTLRHPKLTIQPGGCRSVRVLASQVQRLDGCWQPRGRRCGTAVRCTHRKTTRERTREPLCM